MVACGIVFIVLGVVFFICVMKGMAQKLGGAVIAGIYFMVFGCAILCAKIFWSETIQVRIVGTGIGLLFVGIALGLEAEVLLCNIKIRAVYLRANEYPGKNGAVRYAPVFQYRYGEKDYEAQTAQSFSKRYISKHFIPYETYEVYIWAKKPQSVLYSKGPDGSMILMFVMGISFLATVWMLT